MKNWSLILSLVLFNSALGNISDLEDSLKNNKIIKLTSNNICSINSTHLPINFFSKVYRGGKLEENDKGSINNHNRINYSGFELDLSTGIKILNTKNSGWYITIQHLNTSGAKYPQGLFNLVFVGNKGLEENLSIEKTKFHYRKHQIIHLGLIKKNYNVGLSLGSILNEYQGHFSQDDEISLNSIYNWEINANPNVLVLQNTENTFIKNGNSIGIDFQYRNEFSLKSNKKINYNIGIENFGLMSLHSNLDKYEIDTSFNFTGFSFNEITNIDTTLNNLSNNVSSKKNINKKEVLLNPFIFFGQLNYHLKNSNFIAGVFYRHNSQYIPKTYIGIQKNIKPFLNLGTNISYGGYNQFQLGALCNLKYQKLNINLNLYNLFGVIPNFGKSFGFNLKIQWQIN